MRTNGSASLVECISFMMETPHHTGILKWRPARLLRTANIGRACATRLEPATFWKSGNRWHDAFNFLQPQLTLFLARTELRQRSQQTMRIRMSRMMKQARCYTLFDQMPCVHN